MDHADGCRAAIVRGAVFITFQNSKTIFRIAAGEMACIKSARGRLPNFQSIGAEGKPFDTGSRRFHLQGARPFGGGVDL
jgi:hypothetical protein